MKAGIGRLADLAAVPEGTPVADLAPERLALLHHQARLQANARQGVVPVRRHLAPEPARGHARLPEPSSGDVFFDLEGDPYVTAEGGIEYLWGWTTGGRYDCLWAHDEAGERAALRRFVAMVEGRRAEHPGLHVFHYGAHEASRLRSLATKYATCEATIDDWLRRGVLVDLYAVVRQALQVGEESYSLKRLESHHGFVRANTSVREGGGSIVAYENWLESDDARILEEIRDYNRDDCDSTESLYRWLRETMRPEAEAEHGVDFSALVDSPKDEYPPPAWLAEIEALIGRLHDGLSADPADDHADQAERRLLGHLLLYHYREAKPQYWSWFDLRAKTADELVDEPEAVGLLTLDTSVPPTPVKRSLEWTYRFPDQEVKLPPGPVVDPLTGGSHTLVRIADDHLVLRRGKAQPAPDVRALIPSPPPDARALREAIRAVAESVLHDEGRFGAVRAMLRREAPRLSSGRLAPETDQLIGATLGLDRSYLAVQGPPGTGKTHNGARMVVAALRAGRRVAVTANSHAAIQNLLRAVETHAAETGFTFTGVYRGAGYESPAGLIAEVETNEETCDEGLALVAGTAWLLSRDEHAEAFDLLLADEAGQLALAAAVAAGRCARNLVLLGDPQQLPQVNQASHPSGSGASALEHILDGADVVPPDRGVLLDVSWRMHPEVCAFDSERS